MWFEVIKTTLTPLGTLQLKGLRDSLKRQKPHYGKHWDISNLGELVNTLQFYADNQAVDRMWLMTVIEMFQQLKWNGQINMAREVQSPDDEIEEVIQVIDSIWRKHRA